MESLPFISVRKYIKWGDDPAGENTDTLVLTTPKKHFTDIRIYLPSAPTSPSLPTSTLLPTSRLEWGFAGTSQSTPATSTSPAHTVWTHWVDSKTTDQVQDEGFMHPQPNGEVIEYGSMVNPATGKESKYEECWVDLDLDEVGGRIGWVFTTDSGKLGEVEKGMLVRIGDFVQGVLRKGEQVSVGRWRKTEGKWAVVARIGESLILPPGELLGGGLSGVEEYRWVGKGGEAWGCVESWGY